MADTGKQLSSAMKDEVDRVLEGLGKSSTPDANVYSIEMRLASTLNTSQQLLLSKEIKYIRIIQDFPNNITDKILVELELDEQLYLTLYYLRRELTCELTFTAFDPLRREPDHMPACFDAKYKCIVLDNADIYKLISAKKSRPDDRNQMDANRNTYRMKLELIAADVYAARKIRINTVARGVTMIDMLKYVVHFFGFGDAVIFEPDNSNKYTNFVIPPDYGLQDIMSFMQNAPGMGVFFNGFCSYITDGCWYIYPRYGEPLCKRAVRIYSLGGTNYEGINKGNWKEGLASGDYTMHILINGMVGERNWSPLGNENKVNAANILLDECTIDKSRKLIKDDKFEMNPCIFNTTSIPSDPVSMDNSVNIEFRHSNNNYYTIKSELGVFDTTTITFTWKNAEPFVFHPGTLVQYHFDHPDGYKTMIGMCEKVDYTFRQDPNIHNRPVFAGSAEVMINCNNMLSREKGCY